MGGRGASSAAVLQNATNAKATENMNEAQLNIEIDKTKKEIEKLKQKRASITESAAEKAMQEAFPLGTGGLSEAQANKKAGQLAETALSRSKSLVSTVEKQTSAEKRLDVLEKAKDKIKGTGKTLKEIEKEQKTNPSNKAVVRRTAAFSVIFYFACLKPCFRSIAFLQSKNMARVKPVVFSMHSSTSSIDTPLNRSSFPDAFRISENTIGSVPYLPARKSRISFSYCSNNVTDAGNIPSPFLFTTPARPGHSRP